MDSESCTRAFSQARVYLEQIRSRVAPGGVDAHGIGKRDYLVDAAKQIRLALERDVSEDYEEAFNHYKNGVDVLLHGVQVDPNKERREAVKRKITQYLKRAEEIFNCHLQRTLGNGSSTETGYSSLRFRPIRTLSTPVENLKHCKVVGIIDKVQIVQDPATGGTFILKSLPKSHVETRERQTIIPHGIPFMVELLRYSVSEDSVFLHLEHVKGGTLWSHLRSQNYFYHKSSSISNTLNPKLSLVLSHTGEEGVTGSPQEVDSVSQQSCNFYPQNSDSQIPAAVNRQLFRSDDHLLPRKKSLDHTHMRTSTNENLHLGPGVGTWGINGGKHLSATHTFSATTQSNLKPARWGHRCLANQRLTFRSCDSLIRTDSISSISGRDTTLQEPKLHAGERSSQCVLETGRGCVSKTETPCHQIAQITHSPAGQRQVHPGSLQQNPCGQESQRNVTQMKQGSLLQEELTIELKQHQKQLAPRQSGSSAHQAMHRDSLGAWDVSEDQIQLWAAELFLALEGLHQQGILCRDLNPRNLLLDDSGHIRLTYFGQWTEVEPQYCNEALEDLYCAPEVGGISELTEACDWWSFGALLYELLSGTSLAQNHPSGIHPHTKVHLPGKLSRSASSLLSELLQYDPKRRLGSGKEGASRIQAHPFFSTIQWNKMLDSSSHQHQSACPEVRDDSKQLEGMATPAIDSQNSRDG